MPRRITQDSVLKRLRGLKVYVSHEPNDKRKHTTYYLLRNNKKLQLIISDAELKDGTTKWSDIQTVVDELIPEKQNGS